MEKQYGPPSTLMVEDTMRLENPPWSQIGKYGNYNVHSPQQILERINWAVDTLSFVRRNEGAKLIDFDEISRYACQAFWNSYSSETRLASNDALCRRLNNIMGLFVEYGLRSKDLTIDQLDNDPNYNAAKVLALSMYPDEQTTTWGNQLTVFEAIQSSFSEDRQQYLVDQALNPHSYNFLPAAIEDFCKQLASTGSMPDSILKSRLLNIKNMLANKGYQIKKQSNGLSVVRTADRAELFSLDALPYLSNNPAKIGEVALSYSPLKLVA